MCIRDSAVGVVYQILERNNKGVRLRIAGETVVGIVDGNKSDKMCIRDSDENGRLIPREDYRISSRNCGGEDFAVACMRANLLKQFSRLSSQHELPHCAEIF